MPNLPVLVPITQKLYGKTVEDIPARVRQELEAAGLATRVRPGHRIAITAGSRGIANIATILKSAVQYLESIGARPFLVPAMGSHGGATAEGQVEILEALGVTEAGVGAPIRSSMRTVEVGRDDGGRAVLMDANAWESDGVLVVNRIKAHTDFHSRHESGLVKMIAIGLGKKDQPEVVHSLGTHGLRELIPRFARVSLGTGKIIGGLGILENGYGQTSSLTGVPADRLFEEDARLLVQTKRHAARLPFPDIDVLLVDFLGKNISGAGLDTNVIGRLRIGREPWVRSPRVATIVVFDVTDESHGNAAGTGLADITTQRLVDRMDFDATYTNVMVATFIERGMVPPAYPTDRAAIEAALYLHRGKRPDELRVVRIQDTLHIDRLYASPSLLNGHRPAGVAPTGEPRPIPFDAAGRMAAFGTA